ECLIRITGFGNFNTVKSASLDGISQSGSATRPLAQEAKLLRRAYAPARLAMKYHPYYHGKIEIAPKVPVNSYDDFAIWYTPGVADPCKEIQRNPERWLQPSFGGINLEDISQPKCFDILDALRSDLGIPVWHDDQQGTGTVVCAGLISALKVVGKKRRDSTICMLGAGAANIAVARIIIEAGITPGNIVMVDSKGILNRQRTDLSETFRAKWDMALKTNKEGRSGGLAEAVKGADALLAMAAPGPGVVPSRLIRTMSDDPIVFACANPIPEIWPWEAKEAGAKIVATGRSDFPNQVNNSIGFPAIFRGTLDVRAKMITDEMCIAAAEEIANIAEENGLDEDKIIPAMSDWRWFTREAASVGAVEVKLVVARRNLARKELYEKATAIITHARKSTELLMRRGLIKNFPARTQRGRDKRVVQG